MATLATWLLAVVAVGPPILVSSTTTPSAHRTDALASWSSWSAWSDCSRTCSLGVQTRTRRCLFASGGAADPRLCAGGQDRERRVCDSGRACPLDGGWGPWGPWRCARRCGRSPGKRTRRCDNPTPRWGGRPCRGPHWGAGLCRLAPCVDDLAGALRRSKGSNATLHCADAGRLRSRFPEATLRWEHEGRPLLLDQRRQLFTGGRLGE
ncbi:thrombospondin-1-like [Rhipicephalus microplus]|uniref:thrombospondin-1-like n=1 Tax=Rhipicephalus microplus TaxID=6941 RepID=UPI003F6C36FC